MNSLKKYLLLIILLVGNNAMAVDEPDYIVLKEIDDVEIRQYGSMIIAETIILNMDSRDSASSEGFRRLFAYISGDNRLSEEIDMTAPVIQSNNQQSKGEKIAMTAPVQQTAIENGWLVAFVLPENYEIDTAPQPDDERITIKEIPGRVVAVKRFSGRWKDRNIKKNEELMMNTLNQVNVETIGEIQFAAYNAPFALPFLRRNEVMVELKNMSGL